MRVVIIGLIFVAIILAGGTAYLLRDYLSAQQAEIAALKPVAPTVEVLVAAADMPVGTVVNENNTDWIEWPEGRVPEGFLAKVDDVDPLAEISESKHLARRAITKGEPIVMERLYKSEDPGFLRGTLKPGMRAVAIRTSAELGSGGFILPGDRVDLLLTHKMVNDAITALGKANSSGQPVLTHTSETILEDLRVLAVDQKTNEFQGGAAIAKTILLEVSAKQAEKISTAKAMGNLSLALRAAEDGETRKGTLFTTDIEVSPILSDIAGVTQAKEPSAVQKDTTEKAASTPAPAPRPVYISPAPSKKEITVYRGNQAGAAQ